MDARFSVLGLNRGAQLRDLYLMEPIYDACAKSTVEVQIQNCARSFPLKIEPCGFLLSLLFSVTSAIQDMVVVTPAGVVIILGGRSMMLMIDSVVAHVDKCWRHLHWKKKKPAGSIFSRLLQGVCAQFRFWSKTENTNCPPLGTALSCSSREC